MPSFTKFFTLAACVAAALAVPTCEDAQLVKSHSIPTAGGVISVNSFSCAPRGAVARKRQVVNVAGQICDNSCNDNAGNLPPIADDCNEIRNAVQILGNNIGPTFTVGGYGQQNVTSGTCTFVFTNNIGSEVQDSWSDFTTSANQAASACFPPVMPLHSEGLCSAISGVWSAAAAHS